MKRIHYLQHVPFEGPAFIGEYAQNHGIEISGTALYANEAVPDLDDFDLLLIMGGPMGVHDEAIYPWLKKEMQLIEKAISKNKMIIGICLGAQLIAQAMGASVYRNKHKEIGWFPVNRTAEASGYDIDKLLPESFYAFHWHGDTFDIPSGAVHICKTNACENQAFVYDDRIIGLQFHIESTRESVALLMENCLEEIDGSEFVQDKKHIINESYLKESNMLMANIMRALMKSDH